MAKRKSKSGSLFDDDGDVLDTTPPGGNEPEGVPLHEAAQTRYLNYALSVITSRALPDVRDGLKPVQRRILYTMWQQNLTADAKHRKCAKVVGDVMGNYHPHGDSALYETLVRMAQPFSLRYPLVDGSGNFGSLDGDSAAAMRYTECRLARLSDEMLREIDQTTVPFRPNYDGTRTEPVVLPARIPNLLVNGATGIAVGMATNIPPHNLGEVCTALVKLLDNPDLTAVQLCRYVKGPDFPTGGQILNSPEELKEIYKTGSGAIRLRGTWEEGPDVDAPRRSIYITSIPYTVNKATLVERIADVALSRKLPPLVDVKDVSTDDVRIALELKKDADEKMVMAYLFKHTPLQTNFVVNLTCLDADRERRGRAARAARSARDPLALPALPARGRHPAARARARGAQEAHPHPRRLRDGLRRARRDPARSSASPRARQDAAQQIIARFALDAEQTDAILELKIYRLARLEILIIRKELEEKRRRIRQINTLLKDEQSRWDIVRVEIEEIQKKYGDPRRTEIASDEGEAEYTAEDFIVEEDNVVIVSRDGWVKRQKEVKDVVDDAAARGRRGAGGAAGQHAGVGGVLQQLRRRLHRADHRHPGVDRLRRADSAALQAEGRRADRRRLQPRSAGRGRHRAEEGGGRAAGARGRGVERRLQPAVQPEPFVEPSTRAGRRYARAAEGAEFVGVARVTGGEILIAATREARAMLCKVDEVNFLSGPGRGVILIKLVVGRGSRARLHRVDRRPRPDDGRDQPRRGADHQHHQVRRHRPRRQGPRAAAARPVHPGGLHAAGGAGAVRGVSKASRSSGGRSEVPNPKNGATAQSRARAAEDYFGFDLKKSLSSWAFSPLAALLRFGALELWRSPVAPKPVNFSPRRIV